MRRALLSAPNLCACSNIARIRRKRAVVPNRRLKSVNCLHQELPHRLLALRPRAWPAHLLLGLHPSAAVAACTSSGVCAIEPAFAPLAGRRRSRRDPADEGSDGRRFTAWRSSGSPPRRSAAAGARRPRNERIRRRVACGTTGIFLIAPTSPRHWDFRQGSPCVRQPGPVRPGRPILGRIVRTRPLSHRWAACSTKRESWARRRCCSRLSRAVRGSARMERQPPRLFVPEPEFL